jgi:tripartite-type tricarboxylate transporter receptor subunit TctC
MNRRQSIALGAGLLLAAAMPAAYAQDAASYPSKPIRIIVPFSPNGPNDLLARLVGQKLTQAWGQSVVVDNRPGGGTVIGTELAAKAPADGYTLLMTSTSTAVNPTLKRKLPYDTLNDFARVVRLAASPNVLVTHPALPVRSVRDLLRLAKAKPGEIAYGSGGVGTATHLAGEMLCIMGGVRMTHVPYKGAGPATIDLISGQIQWMFGTILPTIPHIKSGRLRAIAVSGNKRSPALPVVPTVAETLKGFEATSWYGIFAPAGTPKAVVAKLNGEIAKILQSPDIREKLMQDGAEPVGDSPEAFDRFFRAEIDKWGKVIRQAGIEAN